MDIRNLFLGVTASLLAAYIYNKMKKNSMDTEDDFEKAPKIITNPDSLEGQKQIKTNKYFKRRSQIDLRKFKQYRNNKYNNRFSVF